MDLDIRAGAIVHTYIAALRPPKPKFGLVANVGCARNTVELFLIHSELPKFIQGNQTLLLGVTRIDVRSHPFLVYDSWLRFGEVYSKTSDELLRQIESGERCYCGDASETLIRRLLELIPKCRELPEKKQQRYCESLRRALSDREGSPVA